MLKGVSPRQPQRTPAPWTCPKCHRTLKRQAGHALYCGTNKVIEDFWKRIDKGGANGCWIYLGHRNKDNYGAIRIQGVYLAHRLTWTLKYGPVPKGKHVLHRCDNPPCCNPEHLFLGDDATNHADCIAKLRHTYAEKNHKAKLTSEQVAEGRRLRAETGLSYAKIQQLVGAANLVTKTTFYNAIRGAKWKVLT